MSINSIFSYNDLRYVGWDNNLTKHFFSEQIVKLISKKITELTKGVDRLNRSIIVPDERIIEVMDGVHRNFKPQTGDIYSRYHIDNAGEYNIIQNLIDQTIEIVVYNIKTQLGIEEYNKTLSTWVQVYGDFNPHGLRAHSEIKIKEKRPITMQFNMNY
jgi:hypothetical protein